MTLELVLISTLLAGLAVPLGGYLARIEHIRAAHLRDDVHQAVIAFGGGVLIAAVALVLVPHGAENVHGVLVVAGLFAGGAVVFLLIDRAIQRRGTQAGQVVALAMDFVPESIGLGAAFATGGGGLAILLALLIGLQNLPEGFNAYRELRQGPFSGGRTLGILAAMALFGPISGVAGFYFLGNSPHIVGGMFLFAAGGILYVVFHDIAPLAHQRGHWGPTLGAIGGFLVGLVGDVLLNG